MNKLEKNVWDFLDRCCKEVGKHEEMGFSQEMFCACIEKGIESPIEQILYMAIHTIIRLNYIDEADIETFNGENYIVGFWIDPQHKIDKYRVDFLVSYGESPKKGEQGYYQKIRKVIVECDSQAFHERTEPERRYEKARDRYLQSHGYKVFRYTGSEIVKEPMRVAKEIVAFVIEQDIEDLLDTCDL